MPTKHATPEQAEHFHRAMTGFPQCFPDCCLCKATDRVASLEPVMQEIADFWYSGCMQPEFEDVLAELRHWKLLGMQAYKAMEEG